jgi:voltage-gated potassium channel
MYHETKKKVHILLHPELGDTNWDRAINAFIIILIILNVSAVMLETVPSILEPNREFFRTFDTISVIIFTVEYLLRVWSSNHDPRYRHSIGGRLRFIFSLDGLIDLLAILPFYVQAFVGFDLRILRILRLFRFVRLFRLTAYMRSAQMVKNVFISRKNELLLALVLVLFFIIIASCLIYFAEHNTQPDAFSSIPATMWYAVVTATSIGYGDMVPVTSVGKTLSSLISLAGLPLFALPAGIITAGFLEEIRKSKRGKRHTCPHCGKPIDNWDHEDHSQG